MKLGIPEKILTKKICRNYYLNICIYRILLDICFIYYVSDILLNSTYGNYYTQGKLKPEIFLMSWVLLLVSLKPSKKWFDDNKASSIILIFLYYICFIPFSSMFGYACFDFWFSILNIIYWTCLFLFSGLLKQYPISQKQAGAQASLVFVTIVILGAIIPTLYFGYKSHFRIDMNLNNAYDYRFSEETLSTFGFEPYLLGFSRLMIPTGITYSIINKKRILAVVLVFLAMLNYSYDGGKAILFISIAAIFVGFFYQPYLKRMVPLLLNLLLLGGFVEYNMLGNDIIIRIVARRLFFIPNLINSAYYDYMQQQPPNLFRHLLRFIGISSSGGIAPIIGSTYFNADYMNANTGTIGDALWQFKSIGVIVMPIMIVFLLGFFNWTSKKVPERYLIIPCLMFAYYLNNSCFTTALFTHGLLLFSVLIILYHQKRIK